MDKAWAGIEAGKEFHWVHVLDASGRKLLSRKVENDEADSSELIDEVGFLAEEIVWAVDQPGGGAALLLTLLWERQQRVVYIPGLSVDRARGTYRGESKTDARDALVIADQARMRPDLASLGRTRKRSPNCGCFSDAVATSSPTRAEPPLASERHSCRCSRPWNERWI